MKKLITICLVLLICAPAYGRKVTDPVESRSTIERQTALNGDLTLGKTWYVFSGETSNTEDGLTWATAFDTINEAIDASSADGGADRMDFIEIAPGHEDTITLADAIDIDVAGLTLRGHGRGSLQPLVTYDARAAETVVGAANVRIDNIFFRISVTSGVKAIDVESAGDYFEIVNCRFSWEASTDEFERAIIVNDTADHGLIKGCTFDAGGNAAINAIYIPSDIVGITIEDNDIIGDYSGGNIENDEAGTYIIIRRNLVFNGTMGGDGEIGTVEAIDLFEGSSGIVSNNNIVSGAATGVLIRVGDDMVFMDNWITGVDGDDRGASLETGLASILVFSD